MAVARTRGWGKGFPYLPIHMNWYLLRRVGAALVSVAALTSGVAATAAAIDGNVDPAVTLSADLSRVEQVSPTGFAWGDGVRPGQSVVEFADASSPDGWRVVTQGPDGRVTSAVAPFNRALRTSLPLGLIAVIAGGLAIVLLRTHRSWVPAAASVALLAAVPSLELNGNPESSTISLALAVAVPGLWLAGRPMSGLIRTALLIAMAISLAGWASERLIGGPWYAALEVARETAAFWGTAAVVAGSVVVPVMRVGAGGIRRPHVGDVLLVAVAGATAIAAMLVLAVPVTAVGAALLIAVLILPASRHWLLIHAERAFLADVREHAALEAAEDERARLARELHDVPLQELAGVIRRMELKPESAPDADQLRIVAEHLRGVATELRPPVLDDLGLPAALAELADAVAREGVTVRTTVADETGVGVDMRPPSSVELAVFRISEEAVRNALRHANASAIEISGFVRSDRVAIEVRDDGRGLSDSDMHEAGRRGRLGLLSIRRRAQAIDADLSIGGTDGTAVSVRWER